jgi:hypothetical protein
MWARRGAYKDCGNQQGVSPNDTVSRIQKTMPANDFHVTLHYLSHMR